MVDDPSVRIVVECIGGLGLARGLILRQTTAYKLPNALRMTVGTEEANRLVVAALKEFLAKAA